MFTNANATAAVRSVKEQLAASLIAAIEADAKTPFQIAKDAGITYSDMQQFIGGAGAAEPYTKARKTVSLEQAAAIAAGLTDTTPFTINFGFELSPTSSTATPGTQGQAHAGITFNLVNGQAPKTYAVTSGSLPAGLALNSSTGALTGTPTAAGTYNFTVEGTDAEGTKARRAYSMVIAAP